MAIFEIIVNEFPGSSNAYDSLGEALLKKGEKEKALLAYKKSVELNPNKSFLEMALFPTTYTPTNIPKDTSQLFTYRWEYG